MESNFNTFNDTNGIKLCNIEAFFPGMAFVSFAINDN